MKRKPILLALALLLVVGAALWGVNYRLDHPPLTKADKEFRALVAGADGIEISQLQMNDMPQEGSPVRLNSLNAAQTSQLIDLLRFSKALSAMPNSGRGTIEFFNITFLKQGKGIAFCAREQSPQGSAFECNTLPNARYPHHKYQLNPRFNKRLNRALDAYLPQRIRP